MPYRVIKSRPHRKPCLGDLRDEIKLQDRNIVPPVYGSPDFDESYTDQSTTWAKIITVSGKTFFDGVNQDVNITHEITIRYDATVTASKTWVEFNNRRIDILSIENWEERNEWMILTCNERGLNSYEATKA